MTRIGTLILFSAKFAAKDADSSVVITRDDRGPERRRGG